GMVGAAEQKAPHCQRIVAGVQQVAQRGEAACTLGHLASGRVGKVLEMDPETGEREAGCGLGLGELVLVVREQKIDAPGMDVERLTQILHGHRGALDVPAGPSPPERGVPGRSDAFVLRLRPLPESEVSRRLLVVLVRGHSGTWPQAGAVEVGEAAIGRKARNAEVDVAVSLVRIAAGQQPVDQSHHLLYMPGRAWIDLGVLGPQQAHVLEEDLLPSARELADADAGQVCLLDDSIVDVGDVQDVDEPVATYGQMPSQQVVQEVGAIVAQVRVVPDRGTTGVHTHDACFERTDLLFAARQCVVQSQRHQIVSSSTTAWAAMPSRRPSAPSASGEVALTPTPELATPSRSARVRAILPRCGWSLSSWAVMAPSTLTTP